MIELTQEQQRALPEQGQGPLRLVDPRTGKVYGLIGEDVYRVIEAVVDGPNRRGWHDPDLDVYEAHRKRAESC